MQHDCMLEALNRGTAIAAPCVCLYLEHLSEKGNVLKFPELKPSYSSKAHVGFRGRKSEME